MRTLPFFCTFLGRAGGSGTTRGLFQSPDCGNLELRNDLPLVTNSLEPRRNGNFVVPTALQSGGRRSALKESSLGEERREGKRGRPGPARASRAKVGAFIVRRGRGPGRGRRRIMRVRVRGAQAGEGEKDVSALDLPRSPRWFGLLGQ